MPLRVALLAAAALAIAPGTPCRGPPPAFGWAPRAVFDDRDSVGTPARTLLDTLRIRPSMVGGRAVVPPRHMRELYEGLVAGRVAATADGGPDAVVVVRSTAPLAEPHRKNMVIFNMSSLFPDEEVFTAHLHLRRRRMVRQGSTRHQRRMRKTLDPPMHVRLVRVNPHSHKRPTNIASYPVARGERGWRVLDVTAAVRESAAMPSGASKQAYLGIRFEEPARSERRRARRFLTVPIDDFLQARCADEPMAYLVLYSKETEDGEEAEEDDADYRETPWFYTDVKAGSLEDVSGTDNELKVMAGNDIGPPRKALTYADYLDAGYDVDSNKIHEPMLGFGRASQASMGRKQVKDSQFYKKERKQRKGRDISDNELPGDDDGPNGVATKAANPPVVASSGASDSGNHTGLNAQLEVYTEETTPPYSSFPLVQPASWREAEVRRQRDGMWEEANPGGAVGGRPAAFEEGLEGKAGTGKGSARTTEEQEGNRADPNSEETPLKKVKGSLKSPLRSSRFISAVSKDGSEKASRGKGGDQDREDMWRSFGDSKSARRKGGKYQPTNGPTPVKSPKDVAGSSRKGVIGRALTTGNCSLRSYTIDFQELGWSNWLYEPRLFQSGLCTGSCPHIDRKQLDEGGLKPQDDSCDFYSTRHGKTLNMLSALRQWDGLQYQPEEFSNDWATFGKNRRNPARMKSQDPCCAPNSFAPLIMLYVDENEDFVLRLFPRLKVITCSCI